MDVMLLTLLLVKHAIADLYLQTLHLNTDKTKYLGNGHKHYIEHGLGTLLVCLFFVSPFLALVASLLDYLIHWHIDYLKTLYVQKKHVDRDSSQFFRIQTFDQIAHYLTYFALVYYLL